MAKRKPIIVDGANIAFEEKTADGKPKVSNLIAVRKALAELGYAPIIIVDASLIHKVDDPDQLDALIKDQAIRQAPAETDADYFVLETADHEDAKVVSNDRYQPFRGDFPWIEERRVPVMIVNGHAQIYLPRLDGESGS